MIYLKSSRPKSDFTTMSLDSKINLDVIEKVTVGCTKLASLVAVGNGNASTPLRKHRPSEKP